MAQNASQTIPHYYDLYRYCSMLTGTRWDGEDLLQETIIKVLNRFSNLEQANISKAYLFRIATNTWIDYCRKNKINVELFDEGLHSLEDKTSLHIRESIESLVHHLPPKSAAIILLVDVFQFTAKETADMLGDMNEGAVKTAVRRARLKLANVERDVKHQVNQKANEINIHRLICEFSDAIRTQEPFAIVEAYKALQSIGVQVERKKAANRIFFTFTDPEGNILMVSN
ncbi:RNA polymerase sigma-70 factor [Bacillus oleivorans]|uniref:RNA polymerase sigma-70 factor n=1 Tax=Bacillus oleivorans TaxID=1448271 RepID=A0A285D3M1_9BACI|nr:RNA polymerase sigma factor [Bacillus oleivorans]SNX74372.1 RNA polymerase sigma-70 factor [Bacillus oleivorans]